MSKPNQDPSTSTATTTLKPKTRWWKFLRRKTTTTTSSSSNTSSSSSSNPNSNSNTKNGTMIVKKYDYLPPSRGLPKGVTGEGKVFGVALEKSLSYASVAISMVGPDGTAFVYGFVPLLIAKVGMFLKASGTQTEGIFRVSGSTKRINQLQTIFDSKEFKYGRDLNWEGYSMHDAASLLRRYLNMMPDPVIPSKLYLDFVAVLQRSLPLSVSISTYRTLIDLLPPTSRYLLLYLLDLLSVFAQSSSKNLMTASNLATVFQPGLVSTRREEDDEGTFMGFPGFVGGKLPAVSSNGGTQGRNLKRELELQGEVKDSATGKEVLEFLIDNQSSFVLGLERPSDEREGGKQEVKKKEEIVAPVS